MGVASAGLTLMDLLLWQDNHRYVSSQGPGSVSGGMAFAMNVPVMLFDLGAFVMGLLAVLSLVFSLVRAAHRRQKLLSWLHIGAVISLLPFFYFHVGVRLLHLMVA